MFSSLALLAVSISLARRSNYALYLSLNYYFKPLTDLLAADRARRSKHGVSAVVDVTSGAYLGDSVSGTSCVTSGACTSISDVSGIVRSTVFSGSEMRA